MANQKSFKKKSENELEVTIPQADKIDVWRKEFIINKIADINLQIAMLETQKEDFEELLDKCVELGVKTEAEAKEVV